MCFYGESSNIFRDWKGFIVASCYDVVKVKFIVEYSANFAAVTTICEDKQGMPQAKKDHHFKVHHIALKSVTVFSDRAEVIRSLSVQLVPGLNEVLIEVSLFKEITATFLIISCRRGEPVEICWKVEYVGNICLIDSRCNISGWVPLHIYAPLI